MVRREGGWLDEWMDGWMDGMDGMDGEMNQEHFRPSDEGVSFPF